MQVVGSVLRFLFAWIDGIVARVITLVYNLLMQLASLTLYSESIVKIIGQRIGILLGIFMLFRLSVSLINYMISPEKFSDSKQGGSALIKNVIISIILLATVNTIFETAYSVQKKIVDSQIIEKIFFGETNELKMDIGYYLYTGFFSPNLEVIPACEKMWDVTKDLQKIPCDEEGGCTESSVTCYKQLEANTEDDEIRSIVYARNNLDMSKVFSNYGVIMANKGGVFKGQFLFDYIPILSTAAGVIALLIMISFSMELAKRAIKLLFLQIIAPVPIIFNMDTGKGKEVFQKWYKQCFNTYISVFIRLLAIDFAVFIIAILKSEFSKIFQDSLGINIFIIIGCLLFAKEVPKLIDNMFGIKMDGMTLRPLKNFKENALFGNQIAGLARGTATGAIGLATGAIGAGYASNKLGNGVLGATLRGAGRGLVGGIQTGYKTKNGLEAIKAGAGRLGAEADYVNSLDGTTFGGRVKAGFQQRMHIATDADATKKDIDKLNSFTQAADSALKRAEAESVKYNDLAIRDSSGNNLTMAQHKQEQERLNLLRNETLNYEDFANSHGGDFEQTRADFKALQEQRARELQELSDKVNKDTKIFATEYISQISNGTLRKTDSSGNLVTVTDGEIDNYVNQMEYYQKELAKKGDGYRFAIRDASGHINGATIKDSKQKATEKRQAIESNRDRNGVNIYQQQQANAAATKPKGKK